MTKSEARNPKKFQKLKCQNLFLVIWEFNHLAFFRHSDLVIGHFQ